jgi:putative transposase
MTTTACAGAGVTVEARTAKEAARIASVTGGAHLPAKEPGKLSRRVRLSGDFEAHRAAVEAVTVLFGLFTHDGVPVPSGWTVTGASFEVEWPREASRVRSHFGARRYAFNWGLGQVKADMDAKQADPEHESVPWTLLALRKRWNQVKDEVAPWWAENSKECYASGIADLVQALENWSTSKQGKRKGRKVGFPKFKSRNRDRPRVRFTTGAMHFEPDRRTIVVPVIGPLRSKENTRRVERHLAKDNARLISMTLSERWGRLFVAVNYAVRTKVVSPSRASTQPGSRAGVDLGMRDLATVADTQGVITIFPNPAPLRASLAERRRTGKQLARRIPESRGHRAAKAKLARLDRRCVNLRLESHHQFTRWLVDTYNEVVVEDLDLAAMKASMGRRAFRRSVSDTALGQIRPMLAYKVERVGSKLGVAERWFPSSQVHHGCGCRLVAKHKLDKLLVCAVTGELVDRDVNAAQNLRDWPDHASCGSVGATAPFVLGPSRDGTGDGSDARTTGHPGSGCKTSASARAVRGEARTEPSNGGGTPRGVPQPWAYWSSRSGNGCGTRKRERS